MSATATTTIKTAAHGEVDFPERFTNTLPASWFREPALYQLERRSIFSKTWILISHQSQWTKPGHFVRYEMAGYNFFIIRDRKGSINAFINACRHRAFPLVHEDEGTANILACKYHGWSYGLGGNLAKAPRFDTVPEFNKDAHGLYKVHLRIDQKGFVWVNLDSSESPEVSWESQFEGIDTQDRLKHFEMDNYEYDHTWSFDGEFNWKTLVENYNECYHCSTAHPGIAPFIQKDTKFDIKPQRSYIMHLGEEMEAGSIVASPTFMFPNASVTVSVKFFYMMSIVPTSATTCKLRYEFYGNKKSSKEDVKAEFDFFKQVEQEDKWLANNAQKNLNGGAYVSGPFHPYMERAVAYFESILRERLSLHLEEEERAGQQIWPAERSYKGETASSDEAFCKKVCDLSPSSGSGKGVDW